MKYKIYDETEDDVEKIVYLRLKKCGSGKIVLQACDEDGKRLFSGSILSICENGTIEIHSCVGKDLGFRLDKRRHAITKMEE